MKHNPMQLFALIAVTAIIAANGASAAVIDDLPGTYTGSWNNTTYGSSGAVSFVITRVDDTLTLTADMDGYVFGQADPPPVVISGSVAGEAVSFNHQDDPFFGDISGSMDAGGIISALIENIPGGIIQSVIVSGTAGSGVIDLDYTVVFDPGAGGGTAVGTVFTQVPEPSSLALLTLAGLTLAFKKR